MKGYLAAAVIAIATLSAFAPAQASDPVTIATIGAGTSIVNGLIRVNHRQCRPGFAWTGRQCIPRNMIRGGLQQSYYTNRQVETRSPPALEGHCTLPNTVFIAQLGRCIENVRDVAEINKVTPADTAQDPNCVGKPTGFRYDSNVTAPDGRSGIAHHVCGIRPGS